MEPHRMRQLVKKVGLPPGTLVYTGEAPAAPTRFSVIDYSEGEVHERPVESVEDCLPDRDSPAVSWIDVIGLSEREVLERLGSLFTLHALTLEDIMNTAQRPKVEFFGRYVFVVVHMLTLSPAENRFVSEQVSLLMGANWVISFQERDGDVFGPIRDRICAGGRIRRRGADFLLYSLIDALVDNSFVLLEQTGDRLESLELELMEKPEPRHLQEIYRLKRDLIRLRQAAWPLREIATQLEREESELVRNSTDPFLRDLYDHTVQAIEAVEIFRDTLSGLLDLYLSSLSNRMNTVMKVLTIIATIFIPLTFIAGVYGMNFRLMPELQWEYGYPAVLLLMLLVAAGMVLYFKRKNWF